MPLWLWIVLGVVLVGAAVVLQQVFGRPRPCPWWFSSILWIMEKGPGRSRAGSTLLLDRARVAPGMHVLDIGAGPGRISIPAAKRVGTGGSVTALDIQAKMLRLLATRARAEGITNIRTLEADASKADLGRDVYDRAFLVTVLGEIPERVAALRAIHAALKDDGILSVTEALPDPHYLRRSTLLRLAREAGLRHEETHGSWSAYTMNFAPVRQRRGKSSV